MASTKQIMDSGIAAFRAGRVEEAEGIFRAFIKEYPDSGLADNACYNLAKIALSKGEERRALAWYEYLLENYPDSDAAYFGKDEYVELSRHLGEGPKEIADECYFNGVLLFKQVRYDEAEAEFDRLIAQYPDSEYVDNAYYHKGMICKKRGDKAGVAENVKIIMEQYGDTDAALYAEKLL
jgi:TolA-binding protein